MKKITYAAAIAVAAAALTACGNSTPKADLKNDVDTLSYAFGQQYSPAVKQTLEQLELDSAYIDEFLKGVADGSQGIDDKKKKAYNAGLATGMQMAFMGKRASMEIFDGDSTQSLSLKNLVAGFADGAKGKGLIASEKVFEVIREKGEAISSAAAEKKYGAEKKKNDQWMATNAKKEGVKTLGQGVQYKVISEGKGAIPTANSVVTMKYEGKTIDGQEFDKNDKYQSLVSQNVPGMVEALTHMPQGSKWEVYIPYSAGYGAHQAGPKLKPFSTLIFTIELLSVEEAPKAPAAPAAPQAAAPQPKK